jgi:hypothetical protein
MRICCSFNLVEILREIPTSIKHTIASSGLAEQSIYVDLIGFDSRNPDEYETLAPEDFAKGIIEDLMTELPPATAFHCEQHLYALHLQLADFFRRWLDNELPNEISAALYAEAENHADCMNDNAA